MFRLTAAIAAFAISSSVASAQTSAEIIEKHLAALGGRDALARLQTRVVTGTVTLTTAIGPVSGTVEINMKVPNKSRTMVKIDLSALGAGQVINDQRFDGTTGYIIDTLNGNRDITGTQLDAIRNNRFPSPFLDPLAASFTSFVGTDTLNGKPTLILEAMPPAGPKARAWFDADTYMVLKTSVTVDVPGIGALEQVTEFADYRTVDGIKVPFSIKSLNPVQTVTAVVTDVKHNVAIDDASFMKP